MATPTPNQGFELPTVGADAGLWGGYLNANWTALDTLLGTISSTEIAILNGATVTTTEVNYLSGVTDSIQTQLDDRQPLDATLTALAGLSTGANKIPMADGTDTFTQIDFKDEDDMASDSNTAVPSQQSVKAYVDTGATFTIQASGTFSTDSDLVLSGLDFTKYNYELVLRGVVPSSDASNILVRFSSDSGATYITSDYYYMTSFLTSDATTTTGAGVGAAEITLNGGDKIGSAATEYGVNAALDIMQVSGKPISILGTMSYVTSTATVNGGTVSGGLKTTTTAIDAIKLYFSAGTLETGGYTLYRKLVA